MICSHHDYGDWIHHKGHVFRLCAHCERTQWFGHSKWDYHTIKRAIDGRRIVARYFGNEEVTEFCLAAAYDAWLCGDDYSPQVEFWMTEAMIVSRQSDKTAAERIAV